MKGLALVGVLLMAPAVVAARPAPQGFLGHLIAREFS